jgi:copper chaperone CopZ
MRRLKPVMTTLLTAGLLLGAACSREVEPVRTVFTVSGMHCDACSTSIVATLEKVEGVDAVSADHELGVADAVYREKVVSAEELKREIEGLGYTVTGMETSAVKS